MNILAGNNIPQAGDKLLPIADKSTEEQLQEKPIAPSHKYGDAPRAQVRRSRKARDRCAR